MQRVQVSTLPFNYHVILISKQDLSEPQSLQKGNINNSPLLEGLMSPSRSSVKFSLREVQLGPLMEKEPSAGGVWSPGEGGDLGLAARDLPFPQTLNLVGKMARLLMSISHQNSAGSPQRPSELASFLWSLSPHPGCSWQGQESQNKDLQIATGPQRGLFYTSLWAKGLIQGRVVAKLSESESGIRCQPNTTM